ncbi:MAG: class I SAM-dependent methyltransferase [Planctomycetaceae bacterium]|nr:class I SAM-dependent methyltransferase [Planctomycetaceae bacterium]
MFLSDQYQALDFGENRRLERFGKLVLDRPCPAAEFLKKKTPSRWTTADAVFQIDEIASKQSNAQAERGVWVAKTNLGRSFFTNSVEKNDINSAAWQIRHDQAVFELRGTPFGHVGVFPEQADNWDAIKSFCLRQTQLHQAVTFRVLNVFAYTGGSTLAAAQGGAEVVHVDAAKNIVAWARKNAELSQIAPSQVRWIAEDAQKFVRRELKRGNRYQGVVLDPPSYGHGARGEVWRLSKHLPNLLLDCFSLLESDVPCFLLLTCHTPGFPLNRLTHLIEETANVAWGDKLTRKRIRFDARTMTLHAESGATLPSGESVMVCYNDG